jgi:hypothetical protein
MTQTESEQPRSSNLRTSKALRLPELPNALRHEDIPDHDAQRWRTALSKAGKIENVWEFE